MARHTRRSETMAEPRAVLAALRAGRHAVAAACGRVPLNGPTTRALEGVLRAVDALAFRLTGRDGYFLDEMNRTP